CGTGGTAWNNTTGTCGSYNGYNVSGYNFGLFGSGSAGATLTGGVLTLQPSGAVHAPTNINYVNAAVNDTAFTSHIQWVVDAWNLAFILNNATHNGGAGPPAGFTLAQAFSSGAGCEGGFFQAFGGTTFPSDYPPNNIFVVNFDMGNLLVNNITPYYSHIQVYQQLQDPCIPNDNSTWNYVTNKVSTSPIPMQANNGGRPGGSPPQVATGDTYDATIIYTGTAV